MLFYNDDFVCLLASIFLFIIFTPKELTLDPPSHMKLIVDAIKINIYMAMKSENPTVYEVSLKDAQTWVKAYDQRIAAGATKSFLVDVDELNDIIAISDQVQYVRFYFGYNGAQREHPEKLLLVPVDANGVDMINTIGDNSQIYDFTMPCPPTCDMDSPINKE
jgi:hypothetical protein